MLRLNLHSYNPCDFKVFGKKTQCSYSCFSLRVLYTWETMKLGVDVAWGRAAKLGRSKQEEIQIHKGVLILMRSET